MNTRVACDSPTRARSAPRWHIDAQALQVLETVFGMEHFPNVDTRKQLGNDLNVSSRQIQVWFQNRRQRERKLRGEGSNLSSSNLSADSGDESSCEKFDGASSSAPRVGLPLAPLPSDLQVSGQLRSSPTRGSAQLAPDGMGHIMAETPQPATSEADTTAPATATEGKPGDVSQGAAPKSTDSWMSMVPSCSVQQGPLACCWQPARETPPQVPDGARKDVITPKQPYPVNQEQPWLCGGKRDSSGNVKKQCTGPSQSVAPTAVPSVAAR